MMKQYCPQSCLLCPCIDHSPSCPDYATQGYCTTYSSQMREWCPRACRLCANGTHLSCPLRSSLSTSPSSLSLSPIEAEERAVLRRFYNATNGPLWDRADYWCNENVSHCDWHGVECETGGLVTRLLLNTNHLTGTIPRELGQLSQLYTFYIHHNKISGTIPP